MTRLAFSNISTLIPSLHLTKSRAGGRYEISLREWDFGQIRTKTSFIIKIVLLVLQKIRKWMLLCLAKLNIFHERMCDSRGHVLWHALKFLCTRSAGMIKILVGSLVYRIEVQTQINTQIITKTGYTCTKQG